MHNTSICTIEKPVMVVADGHPVATLTDRESEIFTMLAHGKTMKDICRIKGVSRRSVYEHIACARRRLGAVTKDEALAKAVSLGLVSVSFPKKGITDD